MRPIRSTWPLRLTFVAFLACGTGATEDDPAASSPDASSNGLEDAATGDVASDAGTQDVVASDSPSDSPSGEQDAAEAGPKCVDLDGDGYGTGVDCIGPDCDDANPLVNPSMVELADDTLDNDCTGGDLTAAAGPGYYVDQGNGACSDSDIARGSKAKPYCTLEKAVIDAYEAVPSSDPVGRSLFVAKGTYSRVIGFGKSMRLYGGYDATAWTYDPIANETVIGGQDNLDDGDSHACRVGAGCGNGCVCIDWDGWLSVNASANAVVQGFSIRDGKRPSAPLKGVQINSDGRVVIAHNRITAGNGLQNVGLNIPAKTANVWVLYNQISAGTPAGTGATASAYGLNNLGTATLFGNAIDSGPGRAGSWAAAVQNYGSMRLVDNVLNGGAFGGTADDSYGFINTQTGDPPTPGTAFAAHNVIYAGQGTKGSRGVISNSPLTLVNNVVGDRTPGPLTYAFKPTSGIAATVDVGFASKTYLQGNDLVQLIYSDEPSPPNAGANRHLFVHSSVSTAYIDDIASVNTCTWTGCQVAASNVTVAPGFVGASDFHLGVSSALINAGVPAKTAVTGGLATMDIDRALRPKKTGWDIGIHEVP